MLRSAKLITTIWALTLASSCAAQQPAANTLVPSRLVSVHVSQEPALDGRLDDPAWGAAVPLQVIAQPTPAPGEVDSVPVTIRCVHTDSHVYFAMTWVDTTHSVSHKTWTWDTKQKAYKQGEDREDVFALAFEHNGPIRPRYARGCRSRLGRMALEGLPYEPAGIRDGQNTPLHVGETGREGKILQG